MPLWGRQGREQLKLLAGFGTVGIELVVSTVIGFFGGRWLDASFGTEPWLQWIGLACGLIAGFRSLIRATRRAQADLDAGASPDERADARQGAK